MASAVATRAEHAKARASDPAGVTQAVFRELFGPASSRATSIRSASTTCGPAPPVGEPTCRVWRLYMAGSAHAFASGRLNVAQTLFARPAEDGTTPLPPSRADLYQVG